MKSWVEMMNGWGGSWADWAWASAVQSSLLILVVLGVVRGLRGRLNSVVVQGLWMLVLLKLVLPPSLRLPTAVGYWVPRLESRESADTGGTSTWREVRGDGGVRWDLTEERLGSDVGGGQPGRETGLTWAAVLLTVWMTGAVWIAAYVCRAGLRLRREIRRASPANAAWQEAARECAASVGLRRVPAVRVTRWLTSPAVCGLWRGVILVPESLEGRLDAEARRDVLLHEMAHVRRGDLWMGTVETLLLAVYWWHPLVWVVRARLQRVREEIADTLVVTDGRRDAGRYAETLLSVAKSALGRPVLALGMIGILESRGTLRARVESLLSARLTRPPRLGRNEVLALTVFALVALPMGAGNMTAGAAAPGVEPGAAPESVTYDLEPPTRFVYRSSDDLVPSGRSVEGGGIAWTRGGDFGYAARSSEKTPSGGEERKEVRGGVGGKNAAVAPVLDRYRVEPEDRTGLTTGSTRREPVVAVPRLALGADAIRAGGESGTTNLFTREFRLNLSNVRSGIEAVTGKRIGDSADAWKAGFLDFFLAAGLTFEPPRALFLDAKRGALIVRTDEKSLEAVETALNAVAPAPEQVLVDARFVSLAPGHPADTLLGKELSKVLSKETFRAMWRDIERDVPVAQHLGRPRILTLTGRQAEVTIGGARVWQKSENAETVTVAGDVLGSHLEVIPHVGSTDGTIYVYLAATQRDLVGFEERKGEGVPRIRERENRTNFEVKSGQTALLRLTDKPGTAKAAAGAGTDEGIYVFVTVTVVDPAGNPVE